MTTPIHYYSTLHRSPIATTAEAIDRGLAPDGSLYMPQRIDPLPKEFFQDIHLMSFHEIACTVAHQLFPTTLPEEELHEVVTSTLAFPIPLQPVSPGIFALELYHGPTLAFKDVGARFMARMISAISRHSTSDTASRPKNVLVATSGDTGSAVANGFLDVPGVHVFVLYPKGKVSPRQESQFATLGHNITAIEVSGTFDDCQRLVKTAFADTELRRDHVLTSANSINIARLLPQSFYYFWAYAQWRQQLQEPRRLVIAVPSGNFGNLTAGLIAQRMGLPVDGFIAANNRNDIFTQYLATGQYHPRKSVETIANAMDVGAPSNFDRIQDLFHADLTRIRRHITAHAYTDDEIRTAIRRCYDAHQYTLDPHGACAWAALNDTIDPHTTDGIFLETAHPAKFKDTVDAILPTPVDVPPRLEAFTRRTKHTLPSDASYDAFRQLILPHLL